MTKRRVSPVGLILAATAILLLAACGGGDDPSPTEAACSTWNVLLTETPAPSDTEVARRLRAIDTTEVDADVAGAIVAVASRLESGEDISASYRRLSGLCD